MWKNFTVIGPDEIHVVTSGGNPMIYNGRGRYIFNPMTSKRYFLTNNVIPISTTSISCRDKNRISFTMSTKCTIAIEEPKLVIQKLGNTTTEKIQEFVNDMIQSIVNTELKKYDLESIMSQESLMEENISNIIISTLSKIGFQVIVFQIQNITGV